MKYLKTAIKGLGLGVLLGLLSLTFTSCNKDEFKVDEYHYRKEDKTNNYNKGDKLICLFVEKKYITEPLYNTIINVLIMDSANNYVGDEDSVLHIDSINYEDKYVYVFEISNKESIAIEVFDKYLDIPNISKCLVMSKKVYTSKTSSSNVVKAKYIDNTANYPTVDYYNFKNNEDFTPLIGYSEIGTWEITQPAIEDYVYTPSNITDVESGL